MIFCEQNLKPEALHRFFETHFPDKDWFYIDLYSDDDTTHHMKENSIGFYTVKTVVKSYPLEINLTEAEEEVIVEYQLKIAKILSEKFQMKSAVDFMHPEKPDEPFYSLLFDKGDCFLADNSELEDKEEFIVLEPWTI